MQKRILPDNIAASLLFMTDIEFAKAKKFWLMFQGLLLVIQKL